MGEEGEGTQRSSSSTLSPKHRTSRSTHHVHTSCAVRTLTPTILRIPYIICAYYIAPRTPPPPHDDRLRRNTPATHIIMYSYEYSFSVPINIIFFILLLYIVILYRGVLHGELLIFSVIADVIVPIIISCKTFKNMCRFFFFHQKFCRGFYVYYYNTIIELSNSCARK